MATAKRFREVLLDSIKYAREKEPKDIDRRAGTFAAYMTGRLAADEPGITAALRQMLEMAPVSRTDGA